MNYAKAEWLAERIGEHTGILREFLIARIVRASIITDEGIDIKAVESELGGGYIARQFVNRSRKLVPQMVAQKRKSSQELAEAKERYDNAVAINLAETKQEQDYREQDTELQNFLNLYAKLGTQEFDYVPEPDVLEWITQALNGDTDHTVRKQPNAWFQRRAYNWYNQNQNLVDEFCEFFTKYRNFLVQHVTDSIYDQMDDQSQYAYSAIQLPTLNTSCISYLYRIINMVKGLRNSLKQRRGTNKAVESNQNVTETRDEYNQLLSQNKHLNDVNYWASWLIDFDAIKYTASDLVEFCNCVYYSKMDDLKVLLVCSELGSKLDLEKISSIKRFVEDSSTDWDKMCKEILTRFIKEDS